MPSIMKDDKQAAALQEIVDALDSAKKLNLILSSPNAPFQLSMTPDKGRAITVPVGDDERDNFLSLAAKMKNRLSRSVRSKANRFHIALDPDEISLLDTAEPPTAAPKAPKIAQDE